MTRKATWQRRADPHERLCDTEVVRTHGRATRVYADTRVVPIWHEELRASRWSSQMQIGAVTQMPNGALHLYASIPLNPSVWDYFPF